MKGRHLILLSLGVWGCETDVTITDVPEQPAPNVKYSEELGRNVFIWTPEQIFRSVSGNPDERLMTTDAYTLNIAGGEYVYRAPGTFPGLMGKSQMTWTFWIKSAGQSGKIGGVHGVGDPNRIWWFEADNSGQDLMVVLFDPAIGEPVYRVSLGQPLNGNWQFVIVQFDGTRQPADRLLVWVNSALVPMATPSGFPSYDLPTTLASSSNAPFEWGRLSNNGSGFVGDLGEVNVVSRILEDWERDDWFYNGINFATDQVAAGYAWRTNFDDWSLQEYDLLTSGLQDNIVMVTDVPSRALFTSPGMGCHSYWNGNEVVTFCYCEAPTRWELPGGGGGCGCPNGGDPADACGEGPTPIDPVTGKGGGGGTGGGPGGRDHPPGGNVGYVFPKVEYEWEQTQVPNCSNPQTFSNPTQQLIQDAYCGSGLPKYPQRVRIQNAINRIANRGAACQAHAANLQSLLTNQQILIFPDGSVDPIKALALPSANALLLSSVYVDKAYGGGYLSGKDTGNGQLVSIDLEGSLVHEVQHYFAPPNGTVHVTNADGTISSAISTDQFQCDGLPFTN